MTFNKIFTFETLESTNDYARSIVQDATNGTVVVADVQTSGRGRRENNWSSLKGGLYLSLILKPGHEVQQSLPVTLLTALAISRTLEDHYGISSRIKWPNDVLVENRKLAGILVFASSSGGRLHHVIVGVGINLNNPLPDGLEAVSMKELLGKEMDILEFRSFFLQQLHTLYERFLAKGFGEFTGEWVRRAGVQGTRLRDRETGKVLGSFVGLKADGGILYRPLGSAPSTLPETCYDTDIDFVD